MHLGVITSGVEMLPLFRVLNTYDIHYTLCLDNEGYPYGKKDINFSQKRVDESIEILIDMGVDGIIVPPWYEMTSDSSIIIPLFTNYLHAALDRSLIGKIGAIGERINNDFALQFAEGVIPSYSMNKHQESIHSFNKTFPIWFKEVPLWDLYLAHLGSRDWMVRKTLKFDIKYFKDIGVDTLIPCSRSYLAYTSILRKHLASKKIRFHSYEMIEEIYDKLLHERGYEKENYAIDIYSRGSHHMITEQTRRRILLQRGKEVPLDILDR